MSPGLFKAPLLKASPLYRRASHWAIATGIAATLQFAAQDAQAQSEDSVFTYAFRGLGIGVPVGLGAGYLLTRDSDWGSEDWQDLGTGVAIGAISGAVGGIAIGLADVSDGRSGMGAIVLRDTWYGTLLGITIGAIVGGVSLMSSGDGEDMLVGMSWGAVIGAPVGVGVGFAEAALRAEMGQNPAPRYATTNSGTAPSLHFSLTPVMTSVTERRWAWVPTLGGTF
jgi:hypothetical protein